MPGKPFICYQCPTRLERMRDGLPVYFNKIPVMNAIPVTINDVPVDLITHPEERPDQIYRDLLSSRV